MENKGRIFSHIRSAKKSGKAGDGQFLPKVEKYDRGLHFGVTDAHYAEFLALKKKWGLRSLAETARRIWTRGLQMEKGRKDRKRKGGAP